MKCMGSKLRIAKYILPIILKDRKEGQYYVEPFVGLANTIALVNGNRIANDINIYTIEFLKAIQKGWIPPDNITEKQYKDIRLNKDNYPNYLVGFVGIGCSYAGKWFGGFARNINKEIINNNIPTRNYCAESKRNVLKQKEGLIGVEFYCGNYYDLMIPNNSIIYCDPPLSRNYKI